MMYSPAHFGEQRAELIADIVKRYGFSTLISHGSAGLMISHLPLLLETRGDQQILIGHCARANGHWRQFAEGTQVTAIFHGPHSYISPAWYEPDESNVPTWNYAVVHMEGKATILEDAEATYSVLQKLTQSFEDQYETGWSLPANPNRELAGLLNAIVAFEIKVEKVQAKFKLSQNQKAENRNNVIHELLGRSEEQRAVAHYMKEVQGLGAK